MFEHGRAMWKPMLVDHHARDGDAAKHGRGRPRELPEEVDASGAIAEQPEGADVVREEDLARMQVEDKPTPFDELMGKKSG